MRTDSETAQGGRDREAAWRAQVRASLARPPWWAIPGFILLALVGIPLLWWATEATGGWLGLSGSTVRFLLAVAVGVWAVRRGRSLQVLNEETVAHDARQSSMSRLLTAIEALLFVVLAFAYGPRIGLAVAGADPGELGFGGILFLLIGWFIGLVLAGAAAMFNTLYARDNLLLRLAFDGVAIALLVGYISGYREQRAARDRGGETVLTEAIIRGESGALDEISVEELTTPNRQGQMPLHVAVEHAQTEEDFALIERLLAAGTDVNATALGQPVLSLAARRAAQGSAGHIEVMRRLIGRGAHYQAKDQAGWTPLHYAVRYAGSDSLSAIEVLLEAGADINMGDRDGRPPLFFAVSQPGVFAYLLAQGADPYASDSKCGSIWTALRNADGGSVIATAEQLAQINPPEGRYRRSTGPLIAFARGREPTETARLFRYFLGRGAHGDERVRCSGETALHAVIDSDEPALRIELIDALLAAGAEIDARRDKDGASALQLALPSPPLLRHLLERGAALPEPDASSWRTVLDLAVDGGLWEAAEILRGHGARHGSEITSPAQVRAVEKFVEKGADKIMIMCRTGLGECGRLISSEPAHTPDQRRKRQRFLSKGAEITALIPLGKPYALPREAVRIFGPDWEVPFDLGVGASREKLLTTLGPPAEISEAGCAVYRTPTERWQTPRPQGLGLPFGEVRFCFAEETPDRVAEIRWRIAPTWLDSGNESGSSTFGLRPQ